MNAQNCSNNYTLQIGFENKLYSGLPDIIPQDDELLLDVMSYVVVRKNRAGNIVYQKGLSGIKKVLNYAEVYRWSDVIRKVMSRQKSEEIRNDKWLVCGIGKAFDGIHYYFIHPFAQYYQNKIAVPSYLLSQVEKVPDVSQGWGMVNESYPSSTLFEEFAEQLPPISGKKPNVPSGLLSAVKDLISAMKDQLKEVNEVFTHLPKAKAKNVENSTGRKKAVLFGFGNYARTIAIPYLEPYISLQKVHEIDPALLIGCKMKASTNPLPDDGDEKYPVWMIAGFHHTHAELAIKALQNGIIPVIEKPTATSIEHLSCFEKLAATASIPFYQCFQKRYQVFNQYAVEDLNLKQHDPVNYKALVYEIPLHAQHWYNWPVSGSRIISNGCHWIDHFMFLNQYAPVDKADAKYLSKEEILITIKLENGANGIISISDIGSSRIGMREHIELAVKGRACTITDAMYYRSESDFGILRKTKTDKLHNLRLMYDAIGKSIASNGKGDDLNSLRSSFLAIELNKQLSNT